MSNRVRGPKGSLGGMISDACEVNAVMKLARVRAGELYKCMSLSQSVPYL